MPQYTSSSPFRGRPLCLGSAGRRSGIDARHPRYKATYPSSVGRIPISGPSTPPRPATPPPGSCVRQGQRVIPGLATVALLRRTVNNVTGVGGRRCPRPAARGEGGQFGLPLPGAGSIRSAASAQSQQSAGLEQPHGSGVRRMCGVTCLLARPGHASAAVAVCRVKRAATASRLIRVPVSG